MNIKITDLLKKEIKKLIKKGKDYEINELKIKIKTRTIPNTEEIRFPKKKEYENYEREIEDKDIILTYYIWLLAVKTLLRGIKDANKIYFEEASHLFAWCQIRSSDENTHLFAADAPFILCSYMSNGFKYISRAFYSLYIANQIEQPFTFQPKRGVNYVLCLMDLIMADHILKNEKRQVNAPNDLLVALHEQICIIRSQCYVDMLVSKVFPDLSVISSNEDKESFFTIFSQIRDNTNDEETRKIYSELINVFKGTINYNPSFSFSFSSLLPTNNNNISHQTTIDKYRLYQKELNNEEIIRLYNPSLKRTPFPFIPNPTISYNEYKVL